MDERIAPWALALLCGCLGDVGGTEGPGGTDGPGPGKGDDPMEMLADGGFEIPQPEGPTKHSWYSDIGPLLIEKCGACHQEGASGPFPITYEDTWAWRALVKTTTAERTMPPMPVNGDGSCQEFTNARWLTDAEITAIGEWVDEGAARGTVHDDLPGYPATLSIQEPNLTLAMADTYTPSNAAADDYRCFPVTSGLDHDVFLTSYEVLPGSPKVAHHMILYLVHSADQAWVTAEDAKSAAPGYPCDVSIGGANGAAAKPLAVWAPGGGRIEFPSGTGIRIPANRQMVIQMHYNLSQGVEPDLTTIRMKVAASGVTEAMFFPMADQTFAVPGGQDYVTTTPNRGVDTNFADGSFPMIADMTVHGVFPHMHQMGRTLRASYRTFDLFGNTTGEACLVDVDRWDFRWQEGWWYPKPIYLGAGAFDKQLLVQCGFDTTGTNMPTVRWGENTADEMCLNYLYVTSGNLQSILSLLGG